MSEKPEVCEHGSLKRQCLVCELQEELAAMKAERDAVWRAMRQFYYYENAGLCAFGMEVCKCAERWQDCPAMKEAK